MESADTKTIELNYAPLPHQQAVHDNVVPERLIMWGVGSGKNLCGCAESLFLTYEYLPIWLKRTNETPKWQIGVFGPTYDIIKQWQADLINICPPELIVKNVDKRVVLKGGAVYKFVSCDKPKNIVSFGCDIVIIDEAGDISEKAYELIMARAIREGRMGILIYQGTPRGQMSKVNPTKFSWMWQTYLDSQLPANKGKVKSFYWFEDKKNFNNLDHPVLSLTAAGREKLERARVNPKISEAKFSEDFLGECQAKIAGKSAIKNFIAAMNIQDIEYLPRYQLCRSWDFGRNYPAVYFHQLLPGNRWNTLDEICLFEEDLLDSELADKVLEYTAQHYPDAHANQKHMIYDCGDFEATHDTDQRRESTIKMLRTKGINLICEPTLAGDEKKALGIMDKFLKVRNDGQPGWIISPRCEWLKACLSGLWIYPKHKVQESEWYEEKVAEIHPAIDIFDANKYLVLRKIDNENTFTSELTTLRLGQPQAQNKRTKGSWNL